MQKYDLVVIGSGPAGEKAAIQAAKLHKSVLVIESGSALGGACLHRGTIPSKTIRESVLYFENINKDNGFGAKQHRSRDFELSVNMLMRRRNLATRALLGRVESVFQRLHIQTMTQSHARFINPNQVEVSSPDGKTQTVSAENFVIAVGSSPFRPDNLEFRENMIMDSDTILGMETLPEKLTIVGGGVIACEYATIFSPLGIKVNLITSRNMVLNNLDSEISINLSFLMRDRGIRIRENEEFEGAEIVGDQVCVHTKSNKLIKSDAMLYAQGRQANSADLGLEAIGVETGSWKRITVNEYMQTTHPNIYAVGDVIGYPSLASTSMEQGRLAALNALSNQKIKLDYNLLPLGIYTIPEISMVGASEKDLTEQQIPYEVGTASYREIAKGQIMGNTIGNLKILFDRNTLKILGVHIIGENATDIIHIGQTAMSFGASIEYFIRNVFNYPTYSEAYRVACLNGFNRL